MMTLAADTYVPALRWRQGEYQALLRLSNEAKDRVVPYITIPEVEYDFEEECAKKSVHEHVHPFAARYKAKWGTRPAWIGVHKAIIEEPMSDGSHIFSYVFNQLRQFAARATPAIPLSADRSTVDAVARLGGSPGFAITVRVEDLMRADARAHVEALIAQLHASLQQIDLIVDLGAPNFEPYDAFARGLIAALRRFGDLSHFRNVVVIGTAIPPTFRGVSKGGDEIPRHDWMFYQTLAASMPTNMRRPTFGDYTIVHPDFTAMDMRMIKSGGKLVYTTPTSWSVQKGGSFRDNREQMHDHCAAIVTGGSFSGATYSHGDSYIAKCAVRAAGPSNQTRWKEVAINHHITRALDDLATFVAAT